jgi:uncharacterized protein YjcR
MSRADYLETAKRMYVDDMQTFVQISQTIPVNEKTLRKWAKEFGWFELRKQSLTKQKTSVEQAEYIAKKLGDKLQQLLDAGTMPDTQLIQAYRGLVKDLKPIKAYSDEKKKEAIDADKKPELSDLAKAAIAEVFK